MTKSAIGQSASKAFVFDDQYYNRYYGLHKNRVADSNSVKLLADYVCSFTLHVQVRVSRILDMGCGIGLWKKPLRKKFPLAKYIGVEWSDFLCKKYAWEKGSVVDYTAKRPAELVICQGVLQYLDDSQAEAAIHNLAALCSGLLYLEALTEKDWLEACDQKVTDGDVYRRSGQWYWKRLIEYFVPCGGGIFAIKKARLPLFELETLPLGSL